MLDLARQLVEPRFSALDDMKVGSAALPAVLLDAEPYRTQKLLEMIRTWQNRTLRLSNRSDDRMVVRRYFDDEPATLHTFYENIFRLIDEEHIGLDQVADTMKRLLLYL